MITIEHARIRDLDSISAFEQALFLTEQDRFARHTPALAAQLALTDDAFGMMRDYFRRLIYSRYGLLLVAREKDTPVGFLAAYLKKNIPIFSAGWLCEITDIYVLPEYRGRGIGTHLVKEVAGWSRERGAAALTLRVLPSNAGAVEFYRKCGFSTFFIDMRKEWSVRSP